MKKNKKCAVLIVLFLLLALCLIISRFTNTIKLEGKILFNTRNDDRFSTGITIYDCLNDEFIELPITGGRAAFWGEDKILFDNASIYEYDLNTSQIKMVYQDENINYFTPKDKDSFSFSKDNSIFLYNIKSGETILLVENVGGNSGAHSWSNDGNILYYSHDSYPPKIKSYDIHTNEIKDVTEGSEPTVCGTNIAFVKKGVLFVKDLKSGKEYRYSGNSYNYCFSPDGNIIVLQDAMSIHTAIKLIIKEGIKDAPVLLDSVAVWDYKNNSKKILIDAINSSPELICDWRY